MNINGFCDLNVCIGPKEPGFNKALETLVDYGYRVVAFTQSIDCTSIEVKKKKGEKRRKILPEPHRIEMSTDMKKKLIVLNRLTLTFSDASQLIAVTNSPHFKKYHLLALLPTTLGAFQHACMNCDVDIISFTSETKLGFKLSRKTYRAAVQRQCYFEIPYTPMVIDSTCRKNTIHISHLYHSIGKSQNIIVSSGARAAGQMRAPYDIVNLGLLLGLSEMESKFSVTKYCHRVISRARNRRMGKFPINVKYNISFDTDIDEDESPKIFKKAKIDDIEKEDDMTVDS